MSWKTFSGHIINAPIEQAVLNAVHRELQNGYKIKVCIGTDSQVYGSEISIATAIVFIREKCGGFMFIKKERVHKNYSIKERMIWEVSKSVEVAYLLSEALNAVEVCLEVHADINASGNYKSHVAFQEAMGYIQGMGFSFKAKPDAYAGSICADRAVH